MVRGACGRCRTRPVPIPNEEIGMGCKSVFRRCCEIKGRTPFRRMAFPGRRIFSAERARPLKFPSNGCRASVPGGAFPSLAVIIFLSCTGKRNGWNG
jgi:hypothetical protein